MTVIERIECWEAIDRAGETLCNLAPIALDEMSAGNVEAAEAAVAELRAAGLALRQALAGVDRADPQGGLLLRDAQDVLFALKSWAK